MAVSTITYTDKVDLNTTSVADINKVNASDLNEIKTVVNNNSNELSELQEYSTNETDTGKTWTDGKAIYRMVIDIGQLPNATSKSITHNISIETPISCFGIVSRATSPVNSWTLPTSNIFIDVDLTQVYIETTSDRTDLTGVAIIEYTKTS